MIETKDIFQVKSDSGSVICSPETEKVAPINFLASKDYENVLGFNFIIRNMTKVVNGSETIYVENDTPYTGGAKVSISNSAGNIIMPPVPYNLLKHSEYQKYVDRFVEIADVKAADADMYIRFLIPPTPQVNGENQRVSVTATLLYSKRRKTI